MNTPLNQNQIERLATTMSYIVWTQMLMSYCNENYLPKNYECFRTANIKRYGELRLFSDLFGDYEVEMARRTDIVETAIEEAKAEARSKMKPSEIFRLTGIIE